MKAASATGRAAFSSAVPFTLRRTVRFSSHSPSAAVVSSPATSSDHISFIKDIAAMRPPVHLQNLLGMLQAKGETIISPGAKQGLIPLVIPLSKSPSGTLTSLLRWPAAPPGMEMPVVEVRKYGVWLLAKTVDEYIHRMLVEEDMKESESSEEVFNASGEFGMNIYKRGDAKFTDISNLDSYILKKVGLFPDILERKIDRHFEKGDSVSAQITGEFYTRDQFPGFGRPFVCLANILMKSGFKNEVKESARVALKSPWWTLGCEYQEVAELAKWEDEQIDFIREKVSEEGKQADIIKGKHPRQVSLDEAAFLLDLAAIEGKWDESVNQIAECYEMAGLLDIARFISYRE